MLLSDLAFDEDVDDDELELKEDDSLAKIFDGLLSSLKFLFNATGVSS